MTKQDMYKYLIQGLGYNTDGCYPSDRYSNESCWASTNEDRINLLKEHFRKDNNMNFNNTKLFVDDKVYKANNIELTENYSEFPKITVSAYLSPSNRTTATTYGCTCRTPKFPTIENVIFNPPATIVFWSDKTKTIVKADYDYESYDPEKGIAMAIAKKLMGDNKGKYYDIFKHWREKWDKQNEATEDVKIDIPKNPIEKIFESIRPTIVVDDLLP